MPFVVYVESSGADCQKVEFSLYILLESYFSTPPIFFLFSKMFSELFCEIFTMKLLNKVGLCLLKINLTKCI